LTRRNQPGTLTGKIARLNRLLNGWMAYYRLGRSRSVLERLDAWIRRKLRVLKLKQLKRRYTIWKFYRSRGVSAKSAWLAALSGKGWWRLSETPQSHGSMNLKWFEGLGLTSLAVRWQALQKP